MRDDILETAGKIFTGGCHCGAVQFSAIGPLRPIVVCHCTDCLRLAGYSWAATAVADDRLSITQGAENLDWYQSSDIAQRGFCKTCHAQLFYRRIEGMTSIAPGMLDNLDGLFVTGQIYRSSLAEACHVTPDVPELD